jgi:hypothetical protein
MAAGVIKPRRPQWPNPADTPLDRARSVARTILAELAKLDPDHATRVAEGINALGEQWLIPQPGPYRPDEWVTLEEAAQYTGGTRDMIYKWATREPRRLDTTKDNRGRIYVQVGQVLEVQREQRIRRAQRTRKRAS